MKKVTLSVTAFFAGALAFNGANAQGIGGTFHGVAVNPGGNPGGNWGGQPGGNWGGHPGGNWGGGGPGPINGVVLKPGG
jgi:hypothetical protein